MRQEARPPSLPGKGPPGTGLISRKLMTVPPARGTENTHTHRHTHRNSETGKAAGDFLETHNAIHFFQTTQTKQHQEPSLSQVQSPPVSSHFYLAQKPFQEGLSLPVS